jgi:DNA-directed RNA polymerase subunit RPC12/RpoP
MYKRVCSRDSNHLMFSGDKFCQTCGAKVLYQTYKCLKCGHLEYPSRATPTRFCPECGSSEVEFISTDKIQELK